MKRAIVIGLGIFGSNIARTLHENGLEVVAIDQNKDAVQQLRDHSTKAIVADATSHDVVEAIGVHPDDVVIISLGEDLAAAALITLHFKEQNVRTVIVKAPNEEHQKVLEKIGATQVIIPEKNMAQKVARSLIAPNVLDYIPISDEYTICELAPPASFIGKTIGQLNLRAKYHIDVIAIKDSGQERIVMVPRAGSTIKEGDILVVIGKEQDVQNLR